MRRRAFGDFAGHPDGGGRQLSKEPLASAQDVFPG